MSSMSFARARRANIDCQTFPEKSCYRQKGTIKHAIRYCRRIADFSLPIHQNLQPPTCTPGIQMVQPKQHSTSASWVHTRQFVLQPTLLSRILTMTCKFCSWILLRISFGTSLHLSFESLERACRSRRVTVTRRVFLGAVVAMLIPGMKGSSCFMN